MNSGDIALGRSLTARSRKRRKIRRTAFILTLVLSVFAAGGYGILYILREAERPVILSTLEGYAKRGETEAARDFVRDNDLSDEFLADMLTRAITSKNSTAVKTLLAAGANVNVRDSSGHTVLQTAKEAHQVKIERLLRQAGARK